MDGSLALPLGFVAASFLFLLAGGMLWALVRMLRAKDAAKNRQEEGRGSVDFVIETFHDLVSQLKAKEEELERLRASAEDRADSIKSTSEDILRSVPGGVITLNQAREILFLNPAAEEILGVEPDRRRQLARLEDLGPDIEGAVGGAFTANPEERERMELVFRHPRRGRLLLGMRVSDLRNHLNETVGVVVVFNDLTAVRRLEEQVRLREKLTHLGEMSAGIAHELRNPMGVISGYADLLAKQTPESDPRFSSIRAIRDEIKGMNRVIAEFLEFARPTVSPNRGPVAMKAFLEGVRDSRRPDRPGVMVEVKVAPPDLVAAVDEVLLRQALLNLLCNALEALPVGGGRVTLFAQSTADGVSIEVSDTGPGLPPGDLQQLFLPFHTTKDGGTGLGLSIVHKVVICHGGTIEARNNEGGGAVFRIEIPRD